jgi:precorrin-6B methylase 2
MSTGNADPQLSIRSLLETIPLPTLETYSYADAKAFSRQLDQELGFRIDVVEKLILENHPHTPWAGLEPQALQTPYPEIRMMLAQLDLQPGQMIVDLGAAYGRMSLVVGLFHPGVQFIGYEVSPERVMEGKRILDALFTQTINSAENQPKIELFQDDISRSGWQLPDANVYFIYDFGDLESIIRVIDLLKKRARHQSITVVGRGRRTRDHIERHEPWLSQIQQPVHCGNFSIYQS